MMDTIIELIYWQCAALWYSPEAQFIATFALVGWAFDKAQQVARRVARNRPQIAKGERSKRGG